MKIYALYLPQFHEIFENNQWWGAGFTEWTFVKKSKPLYQGHIQPKHPLNNNYYNLLDKQTVLSQTELLKKYGIDGLAYYHYYFNGKLLLERPAENLLQWKDIDQHFFFCWANHSWFRSQDGSKELLVKQTYGTIDDWEKHFLYLLPFFKDDRYEKINNKPMFMLFFSSFDKKEEMFRYFNKRCIDEGFDGIYLIETYHGLQSLDKFKAEKCSATSLIYFREPSVAQNLDWSEKNLIQKAAENIFDKLNQSGIIKKPYVYNGNSLMTLKLKKELLDEHIMHGLWFEWDNTPRHKYRGYVIKPYEKDMFNKYMNYIKNEDFLCINAWNEWGEGMMLEPTEENGYKYLEWIKEWSK